MVVAAAGNDGYTSALANPACTPQVVSVGAVYSHNWGTVTGSCTDSSTAADQVCCFSNSASYLSTLAPGAFIMAGGRQLAGTSQAAPFAAGAVAVLRSAYPGDTLDQTVARIAAGAMPVTDSRNGLLKPRLQLFDSVRPANYDFTDRFTVTGSADSTAGTNVYASKEPSESNHAGNAGGRSVWWRWVAPADGQVALDTHGAGIDTLLAVYTGAGVQTLVSVAANGASGLYFQALSGTEYQFVVDGRNAASGAISLAWRLNGAATADLRISTTTLPAVATVGQILFLTITVTNDGPRAATGVVASGTSLPTSPTLPAIRRAPSPAPHSRVRSALCCRAQVQRQRSNCVHSRPDQSSFPQS